MPLERLSTSHLLLTSNLQHTVYCMLQVACQCIREVGGGDVDSLSSGMWPRM